MKKINGYSFLAIGKTQESNGNGFKKYVGLAKAYPVALNPSKKELEDLLGKELNYEPEYFGTDENGIKWAKFDFFMRTDPKASNNVDILCKASFTLRNERYYTRDKSQVRVIDAFGNSQYLTVEEAEAKKPVYTKNGNPAKLGEYHVARIGEPELCDFLRKLINIPDAFDYIEGKWVPKKLKHLNELTKEEADNGNVLTYEQCSITLDKEDYEKFFKGDTSELWKTIKERMIDNSLGIKMLYGVKVGENGKPKQVICTGYDMMLYKNSSAKGLSRLEDNLAKAKANGLYSNVTYKVQEMQEYEVEPTNLEKPAETTTSGEMPWD